MNTKYICVLALLGTGLMGGTAIADSSTDQLLARYGLFVLDNGDVKSLKRGSKVKTYRVCMTEGRGAVPLKVMHDGQETIVEPGECDLIKATDIKMEGAGKLDRDTVLVGRRRFENSTVIVSDSENAVATAKQPAAASDALAGR